MSAGSHRVLTIAGSDSGGGAGIQADLKTFAAHGVYGASALTAVTAQNTVEVRRVVVLEPALVRSQIEAVLDDIGVDAVKIGMLGEAAVVRAVARAVAALEVPIVLDPVMISKSGERLLDDSAVEALVEELLPTATLVTPNLPELERLTGRAVGSRAERETAARHLADRGPAVLAKGGHAGGNEVADLLWWQGRARWMRNPRIDSSQTHGTGCTLSAAIAARLARGEELPEAVGGAIDYLREAIAAAPGLGRGHGPVDHLVRLRQGTTA
ncbi:MAG: bifunctional hydroxymethylpyrimidine kinase/phosphomethylpyrimidine kinase [Thermoanaerobaculia bacterium]|nr:bifunctional hydroxymethylpyrimidine kinase/phosphomethylpyrimidine kinase [Thermoanaerobaculia bacterium]